MTDQDQAQGAPDTADAVASGDTAPTTTTTDELEAALARVSDLEERLGRVSQEAAKRRVSAREAAKQAEAEARQRGELAAVVQQLEAQLAIVQEERDGLAPLAEYGRAYEREARRRIDVARERYGEAVAARIDGIDGIDAKIALIAAVEAVASASAPAATSTPASATAAPAAARGGAPGASPSPSVALDLMAEMRAGRLTPAQAREADPDQYRRLQNNLGRRDRPPSPTIAALGIGRG